jgi:hypothetical protein
MLTSYRRRGGDAPRHQQPCCFVSNLLTGHIPEQPDRVPPLLRGEDQDADGRISAGEDLQCQAASGKMGMASYGDVVRRLTERLLLMREAGATMVQERPRVLICLRDIYTRACFAPPCLPPTFLPPSPMLTKTDPRPRIQHICHHQCPPSI